MTLRKFGRLYKNEWTKLFARPLIYIMFVLLLLISIFFGWIFKQNASYYREYTQERYEEQWKNIVQNEIADFKRQKLEVQEHPVDQEANGPSNVFYEEVGEKPHYSSENYYDEMITVLKYSLENNIKGNSWKRLALEEIAIMKTQIRDSPESVELPKLQDSVDVMWKSINTDDWKLYLNESNKTIEGMSKDDKKVNDKIVAMRLAYSIPPERNDRIRSSWKQDLLNDYSTEYSNILKGINNHGEPMTEKQKEQAQHTLDEYEYRLKKDLAPFSEDSAGMVLFQSNTLIMVVSVFVIILAATLVASEYTSGTVKLLLIAPYKRWKILLSKCVVMLTVAIIMYGALMLSSLVSGLIFFGNTGLSSHVASIGGKVVEVPFILFIALKYLLGFPELLVMTSLAIMLAVVTRHSAVAIGTGIAFLFGGSFIQQLMPMIKYDWKRFLLHSNINLGQYFESFYKNNYFGNPVAPPLSDMTLLFSVIVVAVYFICINYIAFDSFNRRDIK